MINSLYKQPNSILHIIYIVIIYILTVTYIVTMQYIYILYYYHMSTSEIETIYKYFAVYI